MTDRELMQQALEAMGAVGADHICQASHHAKKDQHQWNEPCPLQQRWHIAFQALRERLAQPEQTVPSDHSNSHQPAQSPLDRMAENARELGLDYEPVQEPVAHLWQHSETGRTRIVMPDQIVTADATWHVVGPLYLTPPRWEWVGLTMDDMADLAVSKEWLAGARWAEAKLREKNA